MCRYAVAAGYAEFNVAAELTIAMTHKTKAVPPDQISDRGQATKGSQEEQKTGRQPTLLRAADGLLQCGIQAADTARPITAKSDGIAKPRENERPPYASIDGFTTRPDTPLDML